MSDTTFGGLAVAIILAIVLFAIVAPAQADFAVAAATLLLALVTYRAVTDARQSALVAQRALSRPVLIPTNQIDQGDLPNAKERMIGIENVGTGVAMNIWGIFLPFAKPVAGLPPQLSMRFPFPLPPSTKRPMEFTQGGTMFGAEEAIAGIPVSVPPELEPDEGFPDTQDRQDRVVARLTLTYEDAFSQIHAAVFDLTQRNEWVTVRVQQGITAGIREIDDAKTEPRRPRRTQPGA